MLEEFKAIKSEKKQLREFGLLIGAILLLIGGLLLWKKGEMYAGLFIPGGLLVGFGLFFPVVLMPLQKAWMALAICIGWVVSRIILTVLYYLVLTPIALAARLTGKQFLDLSFRDNKETYWIPVGKEFNKSDYERQF